MDLSLAARRMLGKLRPSNGFRWGDYLIAIGATLLAFWARTLVEEATGGQHPFGALFFAVIISGWWGGFWPATLSILLGLGIEAYYFLPPLQSLTLERREHQVELVIFVFVGFATAVLSEAQQRAQRRTEEFAAESQSRRIELEREVAERERVQRMVAESEDRFRMIANAAPVMIWVCDEQGLCTFVNRSWIEFTGASAEQALGPGWLDFLEPTQHDQVMQSWGGAFGQHQPWQSEFSYRRADGTYRWLLTTGMPVFRTPGEFSGYIGTSIDITERKEFESTLQEADRRKNEFLAMLSHELRNPLSPMRNVLELVKLEPDPETVAWGCDVMERQLDQLIRLVDDLLDVSRITRGKLTLHREQVALAPLAKLAIETVQPLIAAQRHHLNVTLPQDEVLIDADPTRISQIISNLLGNAAKYTEPGGQLWLEITATAQEAVICVRDTGVGISAEELPHVFELFTQSSRSLDRSQGGLGIGLTLVRQLVELHGGSISATSSGLGRGSEFTVRLPRLTRPEALPAQSCPSGVHAGSHRILVVDDEPDVASSTARLLSAHGHQVKFVNDGPAALEVARQFHPELALLDLGMAGMDGFELARRFRRDPQLAPAMLVALTGWGQDEDRQRSRRAGFDFHLVKPLSMPALNTVLRQLERQAASPPGNGEPPR